MTRAILLAVIALFGAGPVCAQSLQQRIDAAEPGATIAVEPGVYGPISVDRPLTLIGAGGAIIDAGGEGDAIAITAPDVTIRGFTIRGTGKSLDRENAGVVVTAGRARIEANHLEDVLFGIYLKEAPDSVIRANVIGAMDLPLPRRGDGVRLWQSPGCLIEDNRIRGSRDAVMWFSNNVTLRRNHVSHGRYGMHFMYSDDNVLEDNVLEDNSVGAFLMYSKNLTLRRNIFARNRGPSGFGVGLKDMDGLLAEGNLFVGNRVGLHLDNSPSAVGVEHMIRGNVFGFNDIGVAFMPSVSGNVFTENAIVDNIEQIAILGSGMLEGNAFAAGGRGNYWSDYQGFDLDRDGVGDIEYRAEGIFENLIDREPLMRLFLFSPAQHAIESAARAFPVVAPRPKIVDPAPLMRNAQAGPPPATIAAAQPSSGSTAPVAAALLAAGLLCAAPIARSRAERALTRPQLEVAHD
ncbi:MAG: nitrous oxide reductase family maturation protein NosD [Phycisphaerales bacterium JB039]